MVQTKIKSITLLELDLKYTGVTVEIQSWSNKSPAWH